MIGVVVFSIRTVEINGMDNCSIFIFISTWGFVMIFDYLYTLDELKYFSNGK